MRDSNELPGETPTLAANESKPANKRVRDAARTKKRVLESARKEFASHGLDGARLDRIAELAEVDKRLVYYYFKDKANLFRSVLEDAYLDLRAAELELHLEELTPEDAIRQLTAFSWRYLVEKPDFMALVNCENVYHARHLQKSDKLSELSSPLAATLSDVLERGRVAGVFRGGVDPVQFYLSMMGMIYYYLSNRYTLSAIFERDLGSNKAMFERLSHVTDVLLGYLLRD